MEVTGKIKVINSQGTFGTFNKRSFHVTTNDQYPQVLELECHQDKCALLDKFKEGDDVKVSINLRGKEWTNPEGVVKVFNTIVAWRIEKTEVGVIPPMGEADFERTANVKDDEPDDLPF